MRNLLLVAAGGALGSALRYGTSLALHHHRTLWPLGTLTVNLAGCFAIGLLMGLYQDRMALSEAARMFLVVGLLGGFTTFSAFGYEAVELVRRGAAATALLYAAASVGGGLVAAAGGLWLADRL